jgi:predicted hotdog family 3-hydroxylacyl-ACP dehydratase
MHDTVEDLIPHRPPMQWINRLIDCTETTAVATACFRDGDFAVASGTVLETALVECIAQTAAAAIGQRARNRGATGGPSAGLIVAVSDFKIQSRPPTGKDLRIEIREMKRMGAMMLISGSISCEGQPIASGELSLYA